MAFDIRLGLFSFTGGGDVSLFIYLFICYSNRRTALLLYHSIALCASKGGISASVICHPWGVILVYGSIGWPNRLPLATVVACPVTLLSALLHRGDSQRIGDS